MNDIYARLGVRTLINAHGTVTKYGGSVMLPQVMEAMQAASRSYVDLNQLQTQAGKHLATLVGAEAAYITTGAAAGIVLSVAACIAGTNPSWIRQLPDSTGMRNEMLMLKSQMCPYEQQVRQAGGRVVTVGSQDGTRPADLAERIGEATAAVLYFVESQHQPGSLPLADVIAVAHEHSIPVLVDAAAELPPPQNLRWYLDLGADLVQFSGGKDIRGPQSSGLVLGRADLIEACRCNSNPNSSIGRPFKADKETIVGLVTALELYLQQDFTGEMEQWQQQAEFITAELNALDGVQARTASGIEPGIQPACIPRTYVTWDQDTYDLTKDQLINDLLVGEPGIAVSDVHPDGIEINPHMLEVGEENIVASRVAAVFQNRCRFQ